jgi:hypothetical protein
LSKLGKIVVDCKACAAQYSQKQHQEAFSSTMQGTKTESSPSPIHEQANERLLRIT